MVALLTWVHGPARGGGEIECDFTQTIRGFDPDRQTPAGATREVVRMANAGALSRCTARNSGNMTLPRIGPRPGAGQFLGERVQGQPALKKTSSD
jgi:hypothetical protein